MTIQEHLAAFDGWLTHRITEACDACKDLAFRDLVSDDGRIAVAWEHRFLEPGQHGPEGEGWSIYRLQGVWPDFPAQDPAAPADHEPPRRATLFAALTSAVFGQLPQRSTR